MTNSTFKIRDRRFEQFLFFHDIFFITSYREEDGSMVWEYTDTQDFRHVLMEWKEILRKRELRKSNGKFQNPIH